MRPRVLRLPISHYCHKVDWALKDHGVEADQCVVWFKDLIDIRSINPENTVPVLELEDRLVCGSGDILQWLGGESVTGHTLYPSRDVGEWETWADEVVGPLARRDAYRTLYEHPTRYTRNPLVWGLGVAARPLILNVIKSYKGRRYYESDDLERADVLSRIGDRLRASEGPFLFGTGKTAADYATAALLEPFLRIQRRHLDHPDRDLLKAYVRRVKPHGSPYRRRERFDDAARARLESKAA